MNRNYYENLLETECLIKSLENIGIDLSEEKEKFQKLKNGQPSYIQESEVTEAFITSDKEIILKSIMLSLSKYSFLFDLNNSVDYLETLKQIDPITNDTLQKRIEEANKILNIIRKNLDKLYDNTYTLNRSYKNIFEVIKYEIIHTLDSKVLDNVLSNKFDIIYLGNILRSYIKELNESSIIENIEDFKNLQTELAKCNLQESVNGISKELILKFIKCTNKTEITASSKKTLEELQKLLTENYQTLENVNKKNLLSKSIRELEEYFDNLLSSKKDYTINLISLFLSGCLFTGSFIGGATVINKLTTSKYYRTTKEVTIMDEEIHSPVVDTYYDTLVKEKDKLILNVYKELQKNTYGYYRDYSVYYLFDAIRDSDIEYLTIDINSEGVKIKSNYNAPKYYSATTYIGEIRELIKITQDETPSYQETHRVLQILLYILLFAALVALSFAPFCPIDSIKSIYDSIKSIKLEQGNFEGYYIKLDKVLSELLDIIKEDEVLYNKYNTILNSNLLEVTEEELLYKIDKLINNLKENEEKIISYDKEIKSLNLEYRKELKN